MIIKKYAKGTIDLRWDKEDLEYVEGRKKLTGLPITIEETLYEEMTMSDLHFNQINGILYLIDFNTHRIFDLYQVFEYNWVVRDYLTIFFEILQHKKLIKLIPLGKREAKQLWVDLENGY